MFQKYAGKQICFGFIFLVGSRAGLHCSKENRKEDFLRFYLGRETKVNFSPYILLISGIILC